MSQPTGEQIMRQFVPSSPFAGLLGIAIRGLGDGWAELTLPYRDDLATMGDTVHGGAIATLADTTAMAAAWSGAAVPERLQGSTVSLTMQYAKAARGADLVARATVTRRSRRLVFLEVTVTTTGGEGDGDAVAHGVATYALG
jgi:uncharacterized protein (TIGR00369 family)